VGALLQDLWLFGVEYISSIMIT